VCNWIGEVSLEMSRHWQRWLALAFITDLFAEAAHYEQCKDPLFETHWAGKNDIPTLAAFPTVNTNLRKCPAFNERASCCQQGFETEQNKYFEFWRTWLLGKFWRVYAHRASVLVVEQSLSLNATVSRADLEQLEVVKRRYQQVLSPSTQSRCFSAVLTSIAGMMCFSCKPEWFQYSIISSEKMMPDRLERIRIAPSVCVELWAACRSFGAAVTGLRAALRDSRIARAAPRAEESFDMFLSQRRLCNWAHDTIVLHPFRQPSREESDIGMQMPTMPPTVPPMTLLRRLDQLMTRPLKDTAGSTMQRTLDLMTEGLITGFLRDWQGIDMISKTRRPLFLHASMAAFVWMLLSPEG